MKTRFLIIIGIGVAIAITITITVGLEFYQQEYEKNCLEKNGKITGFLSCFNIHQDFVGPKIEGKFAEEICSIVGDNCPPYYWGNFQEDGSIMVAITSWDVNTNTEKSFVFTIKNDTLSYTVRENEN